MEAGPVAYRRHIMWCNHDHKKVFGVANLPEGAEQSFFSHQTFPTVVLAHGLGADHTHMDAYADLLASHGFVTYSIDFCGGGETSKSDGTTLDMTPETERDDLLSAVRLMLDEPFTNKDALFLVGSSQGGYVAAQLAEEMPDAFRGLALVYPAFVLHQNAVDSYGDGADIPDEASVLGVRLSRAYAQAALARDPYANMAGFSRPVLIVHGSDDAVVPVAYSRRAAETYPDVRLEVLEGAGHGFRGADRERSAELVLAFLRSCLAGADGDTDADGAPAAGLGDAVQA